MSGSGLLGKWDQYHETVFPYGPNTSYAVGADWLRDQTMVEDWGCGPGWLKHQLPSTVLYRGIDGSKSPTVDAVVDLVNYKSFVPAIFMRHVLEHNVHWKKILQNALDSFEKKFCLILFTPLRDDETKDIRIHFNHVDVPDLSFNRDELLEFIVFKGNCSFHMTTVNSGFTPAGLPATEHGQETILKIVRRAS